MLNTLDFKTKSLIIDRQNTMINNVWGIALDIGYSSIKGMSPNKFFVIPSYARKITSSQVLDLGSSKDEILLKDLATNDLWAVGSFAQDMVTSEDTNDSTSVLYSRNRYSTPMFKVLISTGLALGLQANSYSGPGDRKVMIQTGLPPKYQKSDSVILKSAMAGKYDFEIKVGNKKWQRYTFEVNENNISIMSQPMGTFFSIATDNSGRFTADIANYQKRKMLIFDPGFGTLDIFDISNSSVKSFETFDDLGMKDVFLDVLRKIEEQYNTEIPLPLFQTYLAEGKVKIRDKAIRSSKKIDISQMLEESNRKICNQALDKIDSIYNGLFDHDYLVVTGGTGEAWYDYIKDRYKNMQETLTIIKGNQHNSNLPFLFSNVRGYYMCLLQRCKQM